MDKVYLYTKSLNAIGEKIIEASNYLYIIDINSDVKDIETLTEEYNKYPLAIQKYNRCKDVLSNVIVPVKFAFEHNRLILELQSFIFGTEYMYKSIDISNSMIDKKMFTEVYKMQ